MKKLNILLMTGMMSILLYSACKSDDAVTPSTENEEEVITTLTYTLTPTTGEDKTPLVLKYKDEDGDGPKKPVYTVVNLKASTTYSGSIDLKNETETPAEDVTAEIKKEELEHQFFFAPSEFASASNIAVAYADKDANQKPIGLMSTLTTTAVGSGKLKITLRHKPNKSATNVSTGDITDAGGETDIEVTFDITVE